MGMQLAQIQPGEKRKEVDLALRQLQPIDSVP